MSQRSWDQITDLIWKTVEKTHPNQLRDWVNCFEPYNDPFITVRQDGKTEIRQKRSKDEIFKTLSCDEYQKDGQKNFLLRLIRDDKYAYFRIKHRDGRVQYVPKVQLAMAFLRAMTDIPECENFIQVTLNEVQIQVQVSRCNSIVHELAKCGFYSQYEKYCSADRVRLLNGMNETPLHLAAEVGNKDDVRLLLKRRADIGAKDRDGCTPLHWAAMAINPDHEIAEMLINAAKRKDYHLLLNCVSTDDKNTALHLAAGNVNITHTFISQFKDADPQRQNAFHDTPFHVAAKSSNPEAIIYMLKTFSPLKGGWDVDDVERDRPKAIEGSSDNDEFDCTEPLETLLTMCATRGNVKAVALLIQHGADISKGVVHDIVDESVKSPQKTDKLLEVYRTIVDNAVTWKCLEENRKTWTKGSDNYKECLKATVFSLITEPVKEGEDDVLERAIKRGASKMFQEIVNTESVFRRSVDESCAWFNITNFSLATTDIREKGEPLCQCVKKTPYLHSLLMHYDDRWADTNIFNIQLIAGLTERYIFMSQLCGSAIGILQMIVMFIFSHFYLGIGLTNRDNFNPNSSNASMTKDECSLKLSQVGLVAWPPLLLLVWTIILCTIYIISSFTESIGLMNVTVRNCEVCCNRVMTMFILTLQVCPHIAFSAIVSHLYNGNSCDLQTISMVLLFGWIYVLWLISNTRKEFSIFTMLLKEVILIDILQSFLPLFFFTVIAFSFSLHVLRIESLPKEEHYEFLLTLYDVFAASFAMGEEMFKNARRETSSKDVGLSLFAVVFMTYMFFTAVILINVLIAMISNRYKVVKRKAANLWRYQTLRRWTMLEFVGDKLTMPVKKIVLRKHVKTETTKDMEFIFMKVYLKEKNRS